MSSLRTFIMGSCVSRDTFEFLDDRGFNLAGYVARQSLISINSPVPTDTIPAAAMDSRFQRRMLLGDLAGDAVASLDAAGKVDLLLWDLTDERLGVHTGSDGWYTRTIEGVSAGLYADDLPHVQFGTDQHFERWHEALQGWIAALRERSLIERTRFLQIPWASTTNGGEETPVSFGLSAQDANAASFRYQRAIMDAAPELKMVRPRVPVIAKPSHQWGLAPFHYTDEVYLDIADQLTA